jgi:DNA-binding NarL/FixJ family response regulator
MTNQGNRDSKIRVLCVDDHALMREAIAAVIRNEPDMLLAAQVCSGHEAIQAYRSHRPDVTLMDLRLSGINRIDALVAIRDEFPDARVIVLTTFESDADMQRALEAGAKGYLMKSMPRRELLEVIRQVHIGQKYVPSETECFNQARSHRDD